MRGPVMKVSVTVGLLLMLGACGDDTGSGSSPTASESSPPGTTADPSETAPVVGTESLDPGPSNGLDPSDDSTNSLSFDEVGWSYVTDTPEDLFRWGGSVTNSSTSAYGNVWLTVLFLDAEGRVLLDDSDWLEYIGPGQTIGIGQQWKSDVPDGVVAAKPGIDSFDTVETADPFPTIEVTAVEAPEGPEGRHQITGWLLNETDTEFDVNQLLFLLLDDAHNVLASVRRDENFTVLPQGETFMDVSDYAPWPEGVVSVVGYVQEATRV